MKTWFIIALLLTGCMKDADNRHIGGLETGPAVIRYLNGTEPGAAQPYIYPARWLLGDLKLQMQLANIKWGQSDIVNQEGVKIHAQSNQYGLADLDEIWIDMSALAGNNKPISIVAFTIYFKEHGNPYWQPDRGVTYKVGEPFGTTGGAVTLLTYRQEIININQYVIKGNSTGYYAYSSVYGHSDTATYNGTPSRPDATTDTSYIDFINPTVQTLGFGTRFYEYVRLFQFGQSYPDPASNYWDDIGEAGSSPYGMYVAPNGSFDATVPSKYNTSSGFLGAVGVDTTKTLNLPVKVADSVAANAAATPYNRTRINQSTFTVNQAKGFIPGDYIITSINQRYIGSGIVSYDSLGNPIYYGIPPYEPSGTNLHSDTGGYVIVFTMSNGDQNAYNIDLDFSFDGVATDPYAFSDVVTAFDPTKGTIKKYSLTRTDNPFFSVGLDYGLVGTWDVVAQAIPTTATPFETIDVFEPYRKLGYKINN